MSASGSLILTGVDLDPPRSSSGAAPYWKESPGAAIEAIKEVLDVIGDVVSLKSDIQGSPTKLSFVSEVQWVSENTFHYTNSVENFTDYAIDFNWDQVGLSGTIQPNSLISGPTTIGGQPTQVRGTASAVITIDNPFGGDPLSGDYSVRANVLAPEATACLSEGDADADNDTDGSDIVVLAADVSGSCTGTCPGDVTGDSEVDAADIARLAANFGKVCLNET